MYDLTTSTADTYLIKAEKQNPSIILSSDLTNCMGEEKFKEVIPLQIRNQIVSKYGIVHYTQSNNEKKQLRLT